MALATTAENLRHAGCDEHSNAYTVWKRLGLSAPTRAEEHAQLEQGARLASMGAPETVRVESGKATVRLRLPRQAMSLLVLYVSPGRRWMLEYGPSEDRQGAWN